MRGKSRDYDRLQSEIEKLMGSTPESDEYNKCSFHWSDLACRSTWRTLLIIVFSAALSRCSGGLTILTWTTFKLKVVDSTIPSNISRIVVCTIQFVGSLIVLNLVDRVGRKVKTLNLITLDEN